MSVAVDRVSLPMKEADGVNKRMAWCGCLTLHDAQGESLETRRYGRCPETGRQDLALTMGSDLHEVLEQRPELRLVTLGDGAQDVQGLLEEITSGRQVDARLVDFWHLVQKLAKAATAVGQPLDPWLDDIKYDLVHRDDAIEHIQAELMAWTLDTPVVPDALRAALTYIDNQRERLRYATARAHHLPIGSGQVEATCKSRVATRMKRAGARWTPEGAQAILNLRSLALSDHWRLGIHFVLDTYITPVREVA